VTARATPAGAFGGLPSAAPDSSGDAFVRRSGRVFILALYGALRAVRLYPVENAAVQKSLDELARTAVEIFERDNELEFRAAGEFIFINATRLRLDLHNYASFSYLLSLCRAADVGTVRLRTAASARDWLVLLSVLQAPARGEEHLRLAEAERKLAAAGITAFELGPERPSEDDPLAREEAKVAAKRTYAHSVAATREVMNSVRIGRPPNLKRIKRAVQSIVDQILNDETSLVGLTTLRDYDEYTFTHSVNVCIFSVALGRRLGLTKLQLYDLGLAAVFHDIGKSRVPAEIINKAGGLEDWEWRVIAAHPWMGVLALFHMRGQQDLPYRAMVVAFEHHMKTDLTGYPRPVRAREMSIFSKIVAVADSFDAATTRRSYQAEPWTPASVLREMRDNAQRGMDPVIVKSFINLTGIYPVGTLVVLDTHELGVVHAPNPNVEALARPVVHLVSDAWGQMVDLGTLVDLTARDAAGNYVRTIIKTADPSHYGIRVSDYFV
jgi:HD-GYP domain-containing protein (c-di-GMP phosphodiesterase class II)